MAHINIEEGKKAAYRGFILLGIVTLIEVFIALLGKGYVVHDFHLPRSIMYLAMISMSLYKAYFIVYEFMHMRYEVPGLVRSVLMPTLLLTWAIIAFFSEGHTWNKWRKKVNDRPIAVLEMPSANKPHEEVKKEAAPVDTTLQSQEHGTKQDTMPAVKPH